MGVLGSRTNASYLPVFLGPLKHNLHRPTRTFSTVRYTDCIQSAVFEHACRLGLEGIVSKRLDSSYRSGPSKVRFIQSAAHHEPETIVFDLMHPMGPGRRPGSIVDALVHVPHISAAASEQAR
jgi:hypothetical protein